MTKQNLIHVKIEPNELLNSKRQILSTEANLIRILQIIKKYHTLRTKELKLKARLLKKLKETKTKLNKLGQTLPKSEITKIPEQRETKEYKTPSKRDDLTSQLEEIQRKLKKLEK